MRTKAEIIKGAVKVFGEHPKITKLSHILNQALSIQEKEFLEMIKRFDYDKNNIAIIEFKDLLTKIVKGRK